MIGIFTAAIIGLLLSSTLFESDDVKSSSASIAPLAQKAPDHEQILVNKPKETTIATRGYSQAVPERRLPAQALPQPPSLVAWPPPAFAPTAGVFAMLAAAMAGNKELILSTKSVIAAFPKPMRGDEAMAREKNEAGVNALKQYAYETAIARLNEGIQANPGDAELRTNLGHALMAAGRLDDAKKTLIDSIVLDAERRAAWVELGVVLAKQSDLDSATAAFIASAAVSKPGQNAIEELATLSRFNEDPAVRIAAAKALESPAIRDRAAVAPPQ